MGAGVGLSGVGKRAIEELGAGKEGLGRYHTDNGTSHATLLCVPLQLASEILNTPETSRSKHLGCA